MLQFEEIRIPYFRIAEFGQKIVGKVTDKTHQEQNSGENPERSVQIWFAIGSLDEVLSGRNSN